MQISQSGGQRLIDLLASGSISARNGTVLDNYQKLQSLSSSATSIQVSQACKRASEIDQQMNSSLDLTLCELEMEVDQQLAELKQLERDYCGACNPPTPIPPQNSTVQSELRESIIKKIFASPSSSEKFGKCASTVTDFSNSQQALTKQSGAVNQNGKLQNNAANIQLQTPVKHANSAAETKDVKITRKQFHKQALTQKQRDDIKRFTYHEKIILPQKPDPQVEENKFLRSINIDYDEIDDSLSRKSTHAQKQASPKIFVPHNSKIIASPQTAQQKRETDIQQRVRREILKLNQQSCDAQQTQVEQWTQEKELFFSASQQPTTPQAGQSQHIQASSANIHDVQVQNVDNRNSCGISETRETRIRSADQFHDAVLVHDVLTKLLKYYNAIQNVKNSLDDLRMHTLKENVVRCMTIKIKHIARGQQYLNSKAISHAATNSFMAIRNKYLQLTQLSQLLQSQSLTSIFCSMVELYNSIINQENSANPILPIDVATEIPPRGNDTRLSKANEVSPPLSGLSSEENSDDARPSPYQMHPCTPPVRQKFVQSDERLSEYLEKSMELKKSVLRSVSTSQRPANIENNMTEKENSGVFNLDLTSSVMPALKQSFNFQNTVCSDNEQSFIEQLRYTQSIVDKMQSESSPLILRCIRYSVENVTSKKKQISPPVASVETHDTHSDKQKFERSDQFGSRTLQAMGTTVKVPIFNSIREQIQLLKTHGRKRPVQTLQRNCDSSSDKQTQLQYNYCVAHSFYQWLLLTQKKIITIRQYAQADSYYQHSIQMLALRTLQQCSLEKFRQREVIVRAKNSVQKVFATLYFRDFVINCQQQKLERVKTKYISKAMEKQRQSDAFNMWADRLVSMRALRCRTKRYNQRYELTVKHRAITAFKHQIIRTQLQTQVYNSHVTVFKVFTIWQQKSVSKTISDSMFDELFSQASLSEKQAGGWLDDQVPLYRKVFEKMVEFHRLKSHQRCFENSCKCKYQQQLEAAALRALTQQFNSLQFQYKHQQQLMSLALDALLRRFKEQSRITVLEKIALQHYATTQLRKLFSSMISLYQHRLVCQQKCSAVMNLNASRIKRIALTAIVAQHKYWSRVHRLECVYTQRERSYLLHKALVQLLFTTKQAKYPGLRLNVILNNEVNLLHNAQYHFDKIFKRDASESKMTVLQFINKCDAITKHAQRKNSISDSQTSRIKRLKQVIQHEKDTQNDSTSKKLQEIRIMLQQASHVGNSVQAPKSKLEINQELVNSIVSDIQTIKTIFESTGPTQGSPGVSAQLAETLRE